MNLFKNNWDNLLEPIFNLKYTQELSKTIKKERDVYDVYPNSEDVLKAFKLTAPEDLKVVIIGQDCYHTPGMAIGLAFGVPEIIDEKQLPPSLKTIIKEVRDTTGDYNGGNSLENWAKQGVLLLNTALTVKRGEPGSHSKLWQPFTKEVLRTIDEKFDNLVFLLWGKHARYAAKDINPVKHSLLYAGHPSPLNTTDKFNGCNHFNLTNDILEENGQVRIIW